MAFDLIFNELSGVTPAHDHEIGRQWMEEFVATLRKTRSIGMSGGLRVPRRFHEILLAPDYPIGRWAGDRSVDRDQREFFRVVVTKAPYLEELMTDNLKSSYELAEFTCEGRPSLGLAVAFLLDSLGISLSSSSLWRASNIRLRVVSIDASTVELLDEYSTVRNASTPAHLAEHSSWISKRRIEDIRDGQDLWERRASLFRSLNFCVEIEPQVKSLTASDPCFVFAVQGLLRLQDFCTNWTLPTFDPGPLGDCSIESQPTMQQYGAERMFTDQEGQRRAFEWHLKKFSFRMYFIPIVAERRILVGYVGRHLRTVKFH